MKYSKDGPFNDPVVRCDACQRLILVEKLKEMGSCVCGARKVRNVKAFSQKEMKMMKRWDIDPDFLVLFEKMDDTGVCSAGR